MFHFTEIPRCKYRCYVCTKMIGDLFLYDFVLLGLSTITVDSLIELSISYDHASNTEGRVITAMGNKFHPECFVCTYCRGPFRDRLLITWVNEKNNDMIKNLRLQGW